MTCFTPIHQVALMVMRVCDDVHTTELVTLVVHTTASLHCSLYHTGQWSVQSRQTRDRCIRTSILRQNSYTPCTHHSMQVSVC